MSVELFADYPFTTVSSGGTTAPASGTSESWTVASSSMFPALPATGSQFHVADPAMPAEQMAVTVVSGTTWTVTRGADSTTPVAHTAGFTVRQVVSAGVFAAFQQGWGVPMAGYRPAAAPLVDKLFTGQSGGFSPTYSGSGSTGNNTDTTNYALGTFGVTGTTSGSSGQCNIAGTFGSALDLTGKDMVIWCQMDTYANFLGGYPRLYLGDTGLSNAYYWQLTENAALPWQLDGEWLRVRPGNVQARRPGHYRADVGVPERRRIAVLR
jgi:hypothetical protein